MRSLLVLLIVMLGAGCATHQVIQQSEPVLERVGRNPAINTVATVPVGGVVYEQFRYWSKKGCDFRPALIVPWGWVEYEQMWVIF